MVQIETDRLFIREWEERYFSAFAAMNADPEVMEYFPSTLTDEQSRGVMERLMAKTQEFGFHFQPVVEKASDRFVGFAGLAPVELDIHFVPAVEIAWRLCRESWGRGYATEAAQLSWTTASGLSISARSFRSRLRGTCAPAR